MPTLTVIPINLTDDGYPDVITTVTRGDTLGVDQSERG